MAEKKTELRQNSLTFAPDFGSTEESSLDAAIVRTVAYADIFDYPVTLAEIHRYLTGYSATLRDIETALRESLLKEGLMEGNGDYYFLSGRSHLAQVRRERAEIARRLWPTALRFGRLMAALPFARMIAVTGSLAVENAEDGADIDFFIVTANGRLWLCRAMVILIVKIAARRGVPLCPNYFLAQRALVLDERNLYAAREVTQMVPLSGLAIYWQFRQENAWVKRYLPNAEGLPPMTIGAKKPTPVAWRALGKSIEWSLRTPPGAWVERWEMDRKTRKFTSMSHDQETSFSTDWCKGHFESHGRKALAVMEERIRQLANGDNS